MHEPMIVAHRGEKILAPENTVKAAHLALSQGANALEVDVRICGSGEIVVMHDALLKRHFGNLVDVTFTKAMETRLDEIAGGSEDWLAYLRQFYLGDSGLRALTARGEEEIKPSEARTGGLDGMGAAIRIGRFGPYAEREENGELLRASLPKDATPVGR